MYREKKTMTCARLPIGRSKRRALRGSRHKPQIAVLSRSFCEAAKQNHDSHIGVRSAMANFQQPLHESRTWLTTAITASREDKAMKRTHRRLIHRPRVSPQEQDKMCAHKHARAENDDCPEQRVLPLFLYLFREAFTMSFTTEACPTCPHMPKFSRHASALQVRRQMMIVVWLMKGRFLQPSSGARPSIRQGRGKR